MFWTPSFPYLGGLSEKGAAGARISFRREAQVWQLCKVVGISNGDLEHAVSYIIPPISYRYLIIRSIVNTVGEHKLSD